MAFEFHYKTLEQELAEKDQVPDEEDYFDSTIKYYSEQEIWYIMECLVSLCKIFKDEGYCHGDIQPRNILIDENGFIKLIDNSLVNYGRTGYLKMVYEGNYTTALSPQLLESLRSRELKPKHDPIKSDVFSIGITMLCACTNHHINEFYDWKQKEVLYNKIKEAFIKMRRIGFSEQLISRIDGCLEAQEERRLTNEELYRFLMDNGRSSEYSNNFMET